MKKFIVLALSLFSAIQLAAQVTVATDNLTVPVYGKAEIEIDPGFMPENPYDYSSFEIKAVFTHESGKRFETDAFYMQDFAFDGEDKYTPQEKLFKARFTPRIEGSWTVHAEAAQAGKPAEKSAALKFICTGKERKGFLKVSDADNLFLEYDDKEPFFARAMNMCWSTGKVYKDYFKWIEKFMLNGGNFIRLWMANWSFGVEWGGAIGNYGARQQQAFMLDQVAELCEASDVYFMLCLVPHGEFSTKVNTNWAGNPYNAANDGILEKPEEFFTNEAARKAFKNRLRYIVARWAYTPSLAAWELFNEVDLTDNYNEEIIARWHSEMFGFLKSIDPYGHMMTTSFADPNKGGEVWKMEKVSFTQTHAYSLIDTAEQLYELSRQKITVYQKPHIIGEFGIDPDAAFLSDPGKNFVLPLQTAIWGASFCLSFGTPMTWYWDNYIDKYGLYTAYAPFSRFTERINWSRGDYYELSGLKAYYKKTQDKKAEDVYIIPNDAWGKAAQNRFVVKNNGKVTDAALFCAYLYGARHPEMRNDPLLVVKNVRPGKLLIKTAAVSHDNTLTVKVNGREALSVSICAKDQPARKFFEEWGIFQSPAPAEYSVDLPVGDNDIEISNTGEDWIKLERITLTEIIDPALAPLFVTGIINEKSAYIYLKNKKLTWQNQAPPAVDSSYIDIQGLSKGRYVVQFTDTFTGAVLEEKEEILDADELRLNVPVIEKDIAVKVERYRKKGE